MIRKISLILSIIMISVIFTNCEDKNRLNLDKEKKIRIKVAAPIGAPALSMVKMFKKQPDLGENIDITYECIKSPDLMASKLISGETDIAVVSSNLAIKIYNKGIDYKYAASSVWGILYVLSSEDLKGWEDLKGKEINMIGRGLTPDIVLRKLLKANGLIPDKDVKFKYINESTELAQLFISGKSTLTIMPEPMVSKILLKKKNTKVILDLQKEWGKISKDNGSYPQAGLIIKNDLITKHPNIVEEFLNEYKESIVWLNKNPSKAGEYSEELKMGLNSKIVEKAITRSNITYKNADESKEALEGYYKILYEFSPELIGGKLPDENFYLQN